MEGKLLTKHTVLLYRKTCLRRGRILGRREWSLDCMMTESFVEKCDPDVKLSASCDEVAKTFGAPLLDQDVAVVPWLLKTITRTTKMLQMHSKDSCAEQHAGVSCMPLRSPSL
jgi:hypothetical protein